MRKMNGIDEAQKMFCGECPNNILALCNPSEEVCSLVMRASIILGFKKSARGESESHE